MLNDTCTNSGSYIDRHSQLTFVRNFCASVLAASIVSIAVFYFWTYEECGITYYQTLLTLQGLRQNILPALALTALIVTIAVTAAILFISLFASHRIAGPIFRLERSLESIGDGDLTMKIRFRPNDAVDGLADEINSLTSHLNGKICEISRGLSDIRKEAEAIKINIDHPTSTLIEKISMTKIAVSDFKTE